MKLIKGMIAALAVALAGLVVYADTVTLKLGPVADSRIFNVSWGFDSNAGTDSSIGIYQSRDRSLIKFLLLDGATINSASLTLHATDLYGGNPNGEAMSIYRLTKAWTEMGVTWNRYDGATAWATAGGDYAGTVYASSTANPASGQPISWDVTTLAQEWASNTYPNNGLIIINSGTTCGLHFASKENGTAAYRPYLTASFNTPTTPPIGSWTWNGGDGTTSPVDGGGTWGDADKWWNGTAVATWSDNNDAIFGAGTGSAGTVTISGSVTPKSLWFTGTGSGNYTLSGGTNDFGGTTRIVHTDINATIQAAIVNGGLLKQGAATLTLSGNNTYSGMTTVSSGTLEARRGTLGTGAVVINNGGTLYANDQWVLCAPNQYGENQRNIGTLTINAGGTLYLDPVSGFANGVANLYLNGGSITGGANSDGRGALFLWEGNEQITAGNATNSSIAASIGLTGNNNTITVGDNSTLNISGELKNSYWWDGFTGGFIKAGNGTLALTGVSTYTGNTTISGGMLDLSIGRLYSTAAWVLTPRITINGNSSVKVGSWSDGDAGNKGGFGPIVFNAANIVLDTGILEYTGGVPSGSSDRGLTIGAGGATLVASGTAAWQITNTGRDGAPSNQGLVCNGGSLTLSGASNGVLSKDIGGTGGLVKTGNGTWTLSGANSYVGNTVISNGMLRLSVTGGAARHFDASTLSLAGGASVTDWNDLSGNGANATVPTDYSNTSPTYLADAGTGTGLGAVSFLKGNDAKDSQALRFARDTNVRSLFSVFKGAGFMVTDSSSYDLHRPGDDNPADALLVDYGQINYLGKVYVNGTEVANPTADAMPTAANNGYNLIEIVGNGNSFELDSFNKDRTYHSGNQSHAETILFDYVVSETQRLQIEAYLNKKWFNIGSGVSNVLPIATSVLLANNSMLDLGSMGQTIAGLSGTGAVSNGLLAVTGLVQPGGTNTVGTLTVPAGTTLTGTLLVDASSNGSCDVLAVKGSVNLLGATLSVSESSVLDRFTMYTVLTCSGMPTQFGTVSVPGGWRVLYRDGSVKLATMGTMISIY